LEGLRELSDKPVWLKTLYLPLYFSRKELMFSTEDDASLQAIFKLEHYLFFLTICLVQSVSNEAQKERFYRNFSQDQKV